MAPEPIPYSEGPDVKTPTTEGRGTRDRVPAPDAPAAEALKGMLRRRLDSFLGTLFVLEGTAMLREPTTGRTREAEKGIRIFSEARLRVTTGRALVRLDDGSDLWISAGSMVDFSTWGPRVRGLRLDAGRVLALVAKDTRRPFRISGAAGEVRAVGTAFAVAALGRTLAVDVFHGSIEFSNDAGTFRAARGRRLEVADRSAPARRGRVSPGGNDWTWVRDLGPSDRNGAIRSAFKATRNTLGALDRSGRGASGAGTGGGTNTRSRKRRPLWFLLILALAVCGWWYYHRSTAIRPPLIGVGTMGGPMASGDFHKATPKEMEEMLSKLPPDVAERLRKQMKENGGKGIVVLSGDTGKGPGGEEGKKVLFYGGDGKAPPGAPNVQLQMNDQMKAAQQTLRDLIKAGVPPDQAAEAVSKGMSDSLTKQIRQSHPNAKAVIGFHVVPQTEGGATSYHYETQVHLSASGGEATATPSGPSATQSEAKP